MEVPGGTELLRLLFDKAPSGYEVEFRHLGPGGSVPLTPCNDPKVPAGLNDGEWFFSVCPRGHNGVVDVGTVVWADFDGNAPTVPYPVATATVRSGKEGGLHCYWLLDQAYDVRPVVRLAKLAALAMESDPVVAESKRMMRLPGSYNLKYSHAPQCSVESWHPAVTYEAEELEEYLVAYLLARFWDNGQRHQMAMSAGALLARADWSEDRVERAVRHVCERTGDPEVKDRVTAAVQTVIRHAAGTSVSSAELRDALDKDYKRLLDALGITARDGDVLDGGLKVANEGRLQPDLAEWQLGEGKWVYADGRPHVWSGAFWRPATPEEFLSGLFTEMGRLKVVKSGLELDFNATTSIAKAVRDAMTGTLLAGSMEEPEPEHLPLKNGVLDLTTNALQPHAREVRNRWVLDLAYDPDATCQAWQKFLLEAVEEPVAQFLQEWVGYCLVAGNPFQRLLWLYGPTSTGKSTFLSVVHALLGPAVTAITASELSDYTRAELIGKRVALCSEISNKVLRTTELKALVSSDVIQARHIYGKPFPARFTGKILWASNSLPPIDQGEGMWRRLALVAFNRQPTVVDEGLGARLLTELPGVLNWALEGLARMRGYMLAHKWPEPGSVTALVNEYKAGADPFQQFAEDTLQYGPELFVPFDDLYQAYYAWAREHGFKNPEPSGSIFRQEIKRIGGLPDDHPRKVGKKLTRCWSGFQLKGNTFASVDGDED